MSFYNSNLGYQNNQNNTYHDPNNPYNNINNMTNINNQYNMNNNQYNTNSQYGYNNPLPNQQNKIMFSKTNSLQIDHSSYYNPNSSNMYPTLNQYQSSSTNHNINNKTTKNTGQLNLDMDLKQKNFTKQQSDTSWVNYQQQSWLKPKLSNHIKKQSQKKFAFPNPFIKYKIIPGVDQKKTLDVTSKDQPQKNLIKGHLIIWDYHGGPNQQFYIHKFRDNQKGIQNNEYMFINASTGFCVSAMSLDESRKFQGFTSVYPKFQNQAAQRWRLKPISGSVDVFIIESVSQPNKVLDCMNKSRDNGTNVIMWDCNKGRNQLWKILPA